MWSVLDPVISVFTERVMTLLCIECHTIRKQETVVDHVIFPTCFCLAILILITPKIVTLKSFGVEIGNQLVDTRAR